MVRQSAPKRGFMKRCGICGTNKPESEFNYSKKKKAYHYACKPCVKTRNREYYLANKERVKAQVREYASRNRDYILKRERNRYKEIKAEFTKRAFDHYGWSCTCCGESEPIFLTIDHINNDGADHRREIGNKNGAWIYKWLVDNSFPDNFQTLCWNCNMGKHRNGGICPHEESKVQRLSERSTA